METLEATIAELNDRELVIMLESTEELVELLRAEIGRRSAQKAFDNLKPGDLL